MIINQAKTVSDIFLMKINLLRLYGNYLAGWVLLKLRHGK